MRESFCCQCKPLTQGLWEQLKQFDLSVCNAVQMIGPLDFSVFKDFIFLF